MKENKKLWEWMRLFEEEGVELERLCEESGKWRSIENLHLLHFFYNEGLKIRIKPEPKKVVLYGSEYHDWEFVDYAGYADTHFLTFEVDKNGKPILGTEKLEEIK